MGVNKCHFRGLPVKSRKDTLFGKDGKRMKHNLKISVSREPQTGGIVRCKSVSLREKLLTRLLGQKEKVMILIPGNSVETLCITEVPEGGARVE